MSLTLLDRMLIIAQHELEAMQQGDIDSAISFFEERTELLTQVQENHDEANAEDCKVKLLALQGYHQLIYEEGLKLRDSIKESLQKNRAHGAVAKRYANNRGNNSHSYKR